MNSYHLMITFSYYYLLILMINTTRSQYIYQSSSVASSPGTRFDPANTLAQFITSIFVKSWMSCTIECNKNSFCRVFDYGVIQPNQCRLFEGAIGILGTIIPSSMPDSRVGVIQITPSLFIEYGQPCSTACAEYRYLKCNVNSICECMPHTYWDPSVRMCLAQMTISEAPCNPGTNMCRVDLNLFCSSINHCIDSTASFSPNGTTIADQNTVIQGSSSIGLVYPMGIVVYDDNGNESLILVESVKSEIIHIQNALSGNKTISVAANNWPSDGLNHPSNLFLNTNLQKNLYVLDCNNQRVVLFSSMQSIAPLPKVIAGITGASGSQPDRFNYPYGIKVDSQGNLYVADSVNNRIMFWPVNASSGITIIGTGTQGSDSMRLNFPSALFLDEGSATLYVADQYNHRIQAYNVNGSIPLNGTTVCGGNGPGFGSNQLNQPTDVWVSIKTRSIYIVDSASHRIQRWNLGASSGVTVAGDANGTSGADAARMSSPYGLAINGNETRMYVTDTGNKRVQLFYLP